MNYDNYNYTVLNEDIDQYDQILWSIILQSWSNRLFLKWNPIRTVKCEISTYVTIIYDI